METTNEISLKYRYIVNTVLEPTAQTHGLSHERWQKIALEAQRVVDELFGIRNAVHDGIQQQCL